MVVNLDRHFSLEEKTNTKHFASLETIKKSWLRLQSGVEIVTSYSGEDEDADAVSQKVCTKYNRERAMAFVVILQFH